MSEQEQLDRLAASRMQVAALHNAVMGLIKAAPIDQMDNPKGREALEKAGEAIGFGEPDGAAIFATCRSMAAAARSPERIGELVTLAERLETFIGNVDGQ